MIFDMKQNTYNYDVCNSINCMINKFDDTIINFKK